MLAFLPDKPENDLPSVPLAGRPYFLFVGRLERIKGLQDIIPAFDNSCPADLVIAGTGAYEPDLRARATGKPRSFLVPNPRSPAALYRGAHTLIAPSICYEALPLMVLEAFQHGIQ